jgi:hypothetical protein
MTDLGNQKRKRVRVGGRKICNETQKPTFDMEEVLIYSKSKIILRDLKSWKQILEVFINLGFEISHSKLFTDFIHKIHHSKKPNTMLEVISKLIGKVFVDRSYSVSYGIQHFYGEGLNVVKFSSIDIYEFISITYFYNPNEAKYIVVFSDNVREIKEPKYDLSARIKFDRNSNSVRTISGGLPSLGKR